MYHAWNYEPHGFEPISKLPSETLPNQSYSIQQIIDRYVSGVPFKAKETVYDVDPVITDEDAFVFERYNDNPDELTAMDELKRNIDRDEYQRNERIRKSSRVRVQSDSVPNPKKEEKSE